MGKCLDARGTKKKMKNNCGPNSKRNIRAKEKNEYFVKSYCQGVNWVVIETKSQGCTSIHLLIYLFIYYKHNTILFVVGEILKCIIN